MTAVIVPSISAERTLAVLGSLADQSVEHTALVVDNGSPDSAVSEACRGFDFAVPLRSEVNLGFSGAVNLAARHCDESTIVLANDDAGYDPGFVEELTAAIDPVGGATMVAGAMRSLDDPGSIDTAGIEIDRSLLPFDYLHGRALATLDDAPEPFGPSGVAAALDREAFLSVGGLDEGIFAYLEDVDLALRLRLAGGRCRLVRKTLGTHQHSATLGSGSPEKNRLMGYARGYLLRKWSVLSARRLPGVIARELVICAGQLVVDRTASGIVGRLAGLRSNPTPRPFPAELVEQTASLTMSQSLGRRLGRRMP